MPKIVISAIYQAFDLIVINFTGHAINHYQRLGLRLADVDNLRDFYNRWTDAYFRYGQFDMRTSAIVAEIHALYVEGRRLLSSYRQKIQYDTQVVTTRNDDIKLGITRHKTQYDRIEVAQYAPSNRIGDRFSGGIVQIITTNNLGGSQTRMHGGYHLSHEWAIPQIGSPPTEKDFIHTFISHKLRNRLTIHNPAGGEVYLRSYWVNRRSEYGPVSDLLNFVTLR